MVREQPSPSDEGRHPSGDDPRFEEAWQFDLVTSTGELGVVVRLALRPAEGVSWFEAAVVGAARPLLTVIDHEAPLPRPPELDIRTEGLWVALQCETPLEHWSIGLEAFGVSLEDPEEALRSGWGERTALGLDLEWEAGGAPEERPLGYAQACRVHGEVLVGRDRIAVDDAFGYRSHVWGALDWWDDPPAPSAAGWRHGHTAWSTRGSDVAALVPPGAPVAPVRLVAADGRAAVIRRSVVVLADRVGWAEVVGTS